MCKWTQPWVGAGSRRSPPSGAPRPPCLTLQSLGISSGNWSNCPQQVLAEPWVPAGSPERAGDLSKVTQHGSKAGSPGRPSPAPQAGVRGLSRRRKERACVFQAERDPSRPAITSSAGTPAPGVTVLSFMTSSLGSAPAQCLVPGINTSWQGPRPPCLPVGPSRTALPSSTQTHHPPHALRQSGSEPGCRRPETLKGLRPALLPRVPQHRALCRWEEAVSVQIQTPPPSPARWAAHMAALGLRVPARQCG